jgi:inorganic triphosphatase YgiF
METELKLHVAPSQLARLRDHPLLAGMAIAMPSDRELQDTYYDTPALDLWHNGVTLRVRQDDGRWIQTVKTATAGSPALHERGEWECALTGPEPAPAGIARQIKQSRIADLLRAPNTVNALRPVFSNTTRRTVWNIVLPDGQRAECALDAGDLHAGGRNAPIGELEFELERGDPTQLFELALALHEEIPLQIANDSKAARGYALIDSAPPEAVKAEPVQLTKHMTMEAAFQCMGLNCLRQIEANVPGVLQQSVESLHQMRVGLRRLRALLDMMAPLAALPAPVAEGLEWLAGELGATRDWDVLGASTLASIEGRDLSALRVIAERRARELHGNMLATLRQPRYTQLILQLNGWFHGRQWREGFELPCRSPLGRPASEAMVPLLKKAETRLAKRIGGLDEHDATARHRVRIAAKKARYAAEFFRDLLPKKHVKAYVRTLSALQDRLGHLNDLAVATRLLGELAASGDTAYALGYVNGAAAAGGDGLRGALDAIARMKMT